jgi:PAS domain S-box-containing protein
VDQNFNNGNTVCSQPICPSGFLHQAIDQSFSPIIITNRKGIINYANPAFSTLTGYSLEELVGASPSLLKSGIHSKIFYKNLWDTILSGNPWQSEICNRKKSGELYWEYQSISPIKDESGNITSFLAIRLDDTQRKEYETELKQLTSNLENSNKDIMNYAKAIEIANMQLQDFSGQLHNKYGELKESHLETLHCLAVAAEFKDKDTGEHITRMSRYSAIFAQKLDYTDDEVENILYAAPMHDIGKLGIPDEIMLKSGKLNSEEFDEIKKHPTIGANILSNSQSPLLVLAGKIALSHHEKWDGSGYPFGLARRDIPQAGHIVAIADSFDALTSRRPYKDPYPIDVAKNIIINEKGKSFDPDVIDAFVDSIEEIRDVKSEIDGELELLHTSFELSERDRL